MENPNFIFSSGPVELKEEGENFFAEGYLSTSDLDLVNDIVTKDCLLDMAEQMKSRTIKMDVEHESFRGNSDLEREINKTIIPVAKVDDFLVDKKGLKIRTMLNKHSQRFEEVKNSIRDGFLDAFSIAFIPVESKIEIREGKEVRLLNRIHLLNSAYTGNPVNTHSNMSNVFAKSLEFLEEQKTKPKTPPKRKIPDSEYEDDEEEEKKKRDEKKAKHSAKWHRCVEKVSKMGGVKSPEAVCTAALGEESYKSNDHENDTIKLQEVKQMTEEDNKEENKTPEGEEENKKPEGEEEDKAKKKLEEEEDEEKKKKVAKKDEDPGEKEGEDEPEKDADEPEESDSDDVEAKDLETLKKDMMEVKAALKRPMLKSRVEQVNKTGIKEEKSLNPLDVIA